MQVVEFRPEPEQYAFTFGGVGPVRKVTPGTVLRLWTEDAFCGNIRSTTDLPSAALTMPFVNPQTGPFYVEGAEPGDALALHFLDLSPARDWGASSTIPFFGGLTSTDRTATLQEPLAERTWIYEVDRDRRTVAFQAHVGELRLELPMAPMLGTVGVAPAAGEVRSSLVPDTFGGNMDTPEMRAGLAADRERRLPRGGGIEPPARGCLAGQPGQHGDMAQRAARAGQAGRLPAAVADQRGPAGQRRGRQL